MNERNKIHMDKIVALTEILAETMMHIDKTVGEVPAGDRKEFVDAIEKEPRLEKFKKLFDQVQFYPEHIRRFVLR